MSYVIAAPEMMTAAATDLATIGLDLSAAHMVAATPTIGLVPAAADEVSTGVAHLFSRYAQDFHGLAGRASAFHEQFGQNVKTGAASYASTEGEIAFILRTAVMRTSQNLARDVSGFREIVTSNSPGQLVQLGLASLLVGGLFIGFIGVLISSVLVGLLITAIRAVVGVLGSPVPPWPWPLP